MSAKQVILITGANKGLGFESARQLGQKGYTVLIGARDAALGAAAAATLTAEGLDVHALVLDVTSEASVAAAAAEVERVYKRLDVLINNAGVLGGHFDPKNIPLALVRKDFEVNVFGVISVTNAFLPLLLKAEVPRIVNLSSILGSHAEHEDPKSGIHGFLCASYNASKAALNLYTQNLALALKDTPAKVNAAHPGWVKTDLGGENAPLEIVDGVKTTVQLATLDAKGPTGGFYHNGAHMRW